jgi:hypothetical protein
VKRVMRANADNVGLRVQKLRTWTQKNKRKGKKRKMRK